MTHLELTDHTQTDVGDSWLRQWVLGGLAAIVLAGCTGYVNAVDARVTAQTIRAELDREQSAKDRERLASLEATMNATQHEVRAIADGLKESRQDINEKLDHMLQLMVVGTARTPSTVVPERSRFDK